MGLEFFNVETKEQLFQINDSEINRYEAIFENFNSKYDGLIDLYGDFRLYSNHLEFLKTIIESANVEETILVNFTNLINKSLSNGIVLLVKGD